MPLGSATYILKGCNFFRVQKKGKLRIPPGLGISPNWDDFLPKYHDQKQEVLGPPQKVARLKGNPRFTLED